MPPLGFRSYYVEKSNGNNTTINSDFKDEHNYGVENNIFQLSILIIKCNFFLKDITFKISNETGLLTEVSMNGKNLRIGQELLYYNGFVGNNSEAKYRSSGAYIFRPNGTTAISFTDKVEIHIYQGELVAEVHQTFNQWVSQVIRIYNTENFIEFDWLVGPIPDT